MDHKLLARRFKALGDMRRLDIMARLKEGETCGCELIVGLGVTQPTLSHHLDTLEASGLTSSSRSGTWRKHRLDNRAIDELIAFLESLKETV